MGGAPADPDDHALTSEVLDLRPRDGARNLVAGLEVDPDRRRLAGVDPLQRVAVGDRAACSVQAALGAALFLTVLQTNAREALASSG